VGHGENCRGELSGDSVGTSYRHGEKNAFAGWTKMKVGSGTRCGELRRAKWGGNLRENERTLGIVSAGNKVLVEGIHPNVLVLEVLYMVAMAIRGIGQ